MSKILHNPTVAELRVMINSPESVNKTKRQSTKEFKEQKEVVIPRGLGFDKLEQLQISNYGESLGAFNFKGL